ncbi:MAG: hypothetical protein WCL32_07560 [Planctomycetota bacterium]
MSRISSSRWRRPPSIVLAGALAIGLSSIGLIWGQQPADPPDAGAAQGDIQVSGYGPVHEAFAQPNVHSAVAEIEVKKAPPKPIEELPPDQKPEGANVVWIPGYWGFDAEQSTFLWVSGFWRNVPPGRVWVPGYWVGQNEDYRWVSGYWTDAAVNEVQYYPPPPDDNSIYIPGIWIYRDTRYAWRPGYWTPYQQGWMWSAPRYNWTPGGYVYVNGYWDYEFGRRGVLFAPVVFGPQYFTNNRYYTPNYVIAMQPLLSALFVQPRYGQYYFGDYYGARYSQAGYTPWVNYRNGGRYNDPTFAYYNIRNNNNPRWSENLRTSYASRQNGGDGVPPRRFQAAQANNTTQNQNTNLVVSLKQADAQQSLNLKPISKNEVGAIQKQSQETQTLGQTRQTLERKLKGEGARTQPTKGALPLPVVTGGAPQAGQGQAPPAPKEPATNPKVDPAAKNPQPEPKDPGSKKDPVGKDLSPKKEPTAEPPPKKQPNVDPPKVDAPKVNPPKVDPPKVDPPKVDPQPKNPAPKTDPPKVDVPKTPAPPKDVPAPKVSPPPAPKVNPTPPVIPPQPKKDPAPAPKAAPPIQAPPPKAVAPAPAPAPKAAPPAPAPKVQAPPPQPAPRPQPQPQAQPAGPPRGPGPVQDKKGKDR